MEDAVEEVQIGKTSQERTRKVAGGTEEYAADKNVCSQCHERGEHNSRSVDEKSSFTDSISQTLEGIPSKHQGIHSKNRIPDTEVRKGERVFETNGGALNLKSIRLLSD